MESKTIVITGASDGIGAEAAKALKQAGHTVVIVGRSPQKTESIAKEIDAPYYIADYAKLADVVTLANALKTDYTHIDVLANNAGALMNKRTVTEDGFEMTFQVNVLAPFLLTHILLDTLCKSNATVIQTSSIAANLFGKSFIPDDLQNEDYKATKAYGRAKLCNILFTRELHDRYKDRGINAVSFHPGISRTNFASNGSAFLHFAYHSPLKYLFTTPKAKSAKRLVYFATATPDKDFDCGAAYSFKKKYKVKFKDPDGVAAKRLWDSCELLIKPYIQE